MLRTELYVHVVSITKNASQFFVGLLGYGGRPSVCFVFCSLRWCVHHGANMVVNTDRAKQMVGTRCDAELAPLLQHIFFGLADNLARHAAKCGHQGRNMCSLLHVCNNKMNTFFTLYRFVKFKFCFVKEAIKLSLSNGV